MVHWHDSRRTVRRRRRFLLLPDIELRFALWGRTPEHKIGEHATARAAQEPKRAVADCRMEPKYRLVLIYVRKCVWSCGERHMGRDQIPLQLFMFATVLLAALFGSMAVALSWFG